MTYAEQLKDPRWQKRRLEILQRDGWACQHCLDTEKTLHVHHRWYERGRHPWDYEDHVLVTLCETCHELVTLLGRQLEIVVGNLSWRDLIAVIGFAKALRLGRTDHPLDPFDEHQLLAMQAAQHAFPSDELDQALKGAVPKFINGKRTS